MAQVFVSPGVYTQEIDDTFRPAGAGAIGAALIGLTSRGVAYRPTNINNFTEFERTFGGLSPDKYTSYAAQNYLRNGSNLKVVRVLGRDTASQGNVVVLAFPRAAGTADGVFANGNEIAAILRTRESNPSNEYLVSGTVNNFNLSATTENITVENLSLISGDDNFIGNRLSSDPYKVKSSDSLSALYIDAIFDYAVGDLDGTIDTGANEGYALATVENDEYEEIVGGFKTSQTPWIVSQHMGGGTVHNLFKIHSVSHGDFENTSFYISISNVDISGVDYPKFTLSVRKYTDEGENIAVYDNLTLDPSSKNYIARVIGTTKTNYDFTTDPPVLTTDGDYPTSRDSYIRVEMAEEAPIISRPAGFRGISGLNPVGTVGTSPERIPIPDIPYSTDHLVGGQISESGYMGWPSTNSGVKSLLKPTISSASGELNVSKGFIVANNAAEASASSVSDFTAEFQLKDLNFSASGSQVSTSNVVKFSVPLFGGFDGYDKRVDLRIAANSTGDTSITGDFEKAIRVLSNPDQVDFNLLAMPDITSSNAGNIPQKALDMVTTRGDAFLLIDLAGDNSTSADGINTTVTQAVAESNKYDSSYGACYYPWLKIPDTSNQNGNAFVSVPPSVAMMGVYAFNDRVSDPWFAPAGFNRGNSFPGGTTALTPLNQTQRDTLYSANVNPIGEFVNQGIAAFGQKTLQTKQSVLDRINVRRMMIEVRKTIAGLSRLFLFEPNTVEVRRTLLTQVNNYLTVVQNRQGLTEFRAVLDETTTTPDLIDRNTMKGKIFLKPTSAAEVILFDFTVTPQGASFSE